MQTLVPDPTDVLLHLRVAAGRHPKARYASLQTLRLWHRVGLKVEGGTVKLRAEKIGRRLFTSVAWVDEFIRAVNPPRAVPTGRRGFNVFVAAK